MQANGKRNVWSIELLFEETERDTQTEAVLDLGGERIGGWGRARRNPDDPSVPRVGEELAAARALSDLSHRLLDDAARSIEAFEGRPVHVHP